MQLSEVNQALDHKISGGSEYLWHCFPDARYLDYSSEHAYVSVLFSTKNQNVYIAEVSHKEDENVAYRWIDPDYIEAYKKESLERGIDWQEAWDYVKWTDLEVKEDWFRKAVAIFNGLEYDKRVSIPIEFTDDELLKYMKYAHECDITFNQFIEKALLALIERHKSTT